MKSLTTKPFTPLLIVVPAVIAWIGMGALRAEVKKILEKTLFETTSQCTRYSEASILSLDGGKNLLMVVTVYGTADHDTSAARLLAWRSRDGGLTWKEDSPHEFLEHIGKQSTRIASFLRLSRSEVLFFFMVVNGEYDSGVWMRRSLNNGMTWQPAVRLPYEDYGGMANDHAVLLKRGRIVLPCWVSHDGMKSTYSFTFYSDNEGNTWKKSNEITVRPPSKGRDTSPAAEEPTVVELKDGRLLMLIRTYVGSFFKSYSTDGGITWSEPVDSGIPAPGSQPVLVRIPGTGDLLLLFNYGEAGAISGPWPRTRIASAISRDEGRNFTSIRILDGSPEFKGKITMANVAFSGKNAVMGYSKSPNQRNNYSWMLQVLPISWFYEGDRSTIYGENYLTKSVPAGK